MRKNLQILRKSAELNLLIFIQVVLESGDFCMFGKKRPWCAEMAKPLPYRHIHSCTDVPIADVLALL
jgi:hypothetical protein